MKALTGGIGSVTDWKVVAKWGFVIAGTGKNEDTTGRELF